MAKNKHTFIAYTEWSDIFGMLSDEEAGRLIKHTLAYVNDLHPVFGPDDRVLAVAFKPIEITLKKDLVKYEAIRQKRSESGRVGGISKNKKNTATVTKIKTEEVKQKEESIPNSNYGDGVLHYQCLNHAKLNPGKYTKDMYSAFLMYWTATLQKGRNKGRELWRDQDTWNIEGRLATWNSRESKNNKTDGKQQYLQSVGTSLDKLIAAAN